MAWIGLPIHQFWLIVIDSGGECVPPFSAKIAELKQYISAGCETIPSITSFVAKNIIYHKYHQFLEFFRLILKHPALAMWKILPDTFWKIFYYKIIIIEYISVFKYYIPLKIEKGKETFSNTKFFYLPVK